MSTSKRQVEIFSAGCPVCSAAVDLVRRIACPSCAVTVMDMHQPDVAARATTLGIARLPAVVVNGEVADCCRAGAIDEQTLRDAGVGMALGD